MRVRDKGIRIGNGIYPGLESQGRFRARARTDPRV
jgi:hypothetical protein